MKDDITLENFVGLVTSSVYRKKIDFKRRKFRSFRANFMTSST